MDRPIPKTSVPSYTLPDIAPHLACFWIDAGQVYPRYELDGGRLIGVAVTAVDIDAVDAVLVGALRKTGSASPSVRIGELVRATHVGRSKDCAIPVGHHQVIAVRQTIGTCLCTRSISLGPGHEKRGIVRLPAPSPFSPFSSSSSSRKFRGTFAPILSN